MKDIGGIAIKSASIELRLIIAGICEEKNIPVLKSISEPCNESIKHHPHVQFFDNLVDSFRGKHVNFHY